MSPRPHFDPAAEEPIYRQLAAYLRAEITAGRLAHGERIPPTRELAGQLGLNRTTVAAAYEVLEEEGLLKGHVGRGSFVQSRPVGMNWDELLPPRPALDVPSLGALPEATIRFDSARPSEELFPWPAFQATVREVLLGDGAAHLLQLGSPYGYAPLRQYLVGQARGAGLFQPGDELLVTNGCQQALDLIQRTFTNAGDTVLVEDPVYPGLKNVFLRAGVRLAGVPVRESGLDLDALERLLAVERPRLLVLTPTFQNPTGLAMGRPQREAALRLARSARVPVIENDIYADLRYAGDEVPALKQLDHDGGVVHIKSFSKLAFPGLRVGWITGPRAVVERLAELKQWTDLHTDQLAQAVLLRFAESGRLAEHRTHMQRAGRERRQAVLAALDQQLGKHARFTRPEGGMSLWVRLQEAVDASALLKRALEEGVSFLPGRYFAVHRAEPGAFRLSFAGLPPAQIRAGVAILARLIQQERSRHESSPAERAAAIV